MSKYYCTALDIGEELVVARCDNLSDALDFVEEHIGHYLVCVIDTEKNEVLDYDVNGSLRDTLSIAEI
jgi:hypothetical protein